MIDYSVENVITIGPKDYPYYRFDNSRIVLNSINGVFSVDTIGNELSVDTFAFTVRYDPAAEPQVYAPVGDDVYELVNGPVYELATAEGRDYMMELAYATPVYWWCGGQFFTKAYLKQVERIGRYAWRLTCISGVGLLNDDYHEGGIYSGAMLEDIAADIIGDAFRYSVSPVAGTVIVNGWLPYDTRRANLHRLLFATGASLLRGDADTDYTIGFLTDSDEPPVIGPERVAINGRTSYLLPATAVEVTEHSFLQTSADEDTTLYDNTDGGIASGLRLVFGGPYYDLATTGSLVIEDSGVNFAVVSGVGTLTGKPYTHITAMIRDGNDTRLTKKVTADNALISALNSQSVAKRALTYFQSAKTVEAKIALEGERCGLIYDVTDAFGDLTRAFLKQMTVTPTSVVAAACQFVAGYTPTGQGNYYNNRVLLTASGTWTAPAGVTRARIILIGGGNGGDGGYDGQDGAEPEYLIVIEEPEAIQGWGYEEQTAPLGGAGGSGGTPGKVYAIDVDVTPGDVLTFTIGSGGAGGAANGGLGAPGAPTTVSSDPLNASSEDGSVVPAYADPISGDLFAMPGAAGISGADGGLTDTFSLEGCAGADGYPGGAVGEYTGGAGGNGKVHEDIGLPPAYDRYYYDGSGGAGGGAAYGADGAAGGGAWVTYEGTPPGPIAFFVHFAPGGAGADAQAPALAGLGCGGAGGNGGGAGGNGGGGRLYTFLGRTYKGAGGAGGHGTAGADGGSGAALILF